jgi:hypothetical protein
MTHCPSMNVLRKKAARRGLTIAVDRRDKGKPYTVMKIGDNRNNAVRCATDLDLHAEILRWPLSERQ